MIRCKVCIYPDSRPDTHFVDGVCSACRSYAERKDVDWLRRAQALDELLKEGREQSDGGYDCIVPVSGGKDSTYQVLVIKALGYNPLGVCAGTDLLSQIGRKNLDNLKHHCDVVEVTPNREVRKRLIKIGLDRVGDLSWPEHNAIWAIPTSEAIARSIPLIVWGEQPQREYASPQDVEPATYLDDHWVAEFGGQLGLRPADLVAEGLFTSEQMIPYTFPVTARDTLVRGIWLGDYLDWDGWRNGLIAQQYGFETLPSPVEGSLADYENLDNHVTVLRDYMRFLKYGYGRATDIACNHIRRGRLTRAWGLRLVERAERFPRTSLGENVEWVLKECGISWNEWLNACEKWTNPDVFERKLSGFARLADGITPVLKAPGYSL